MNVRPSLTRAVLVCGLAMLLASTTAADPGTKGKAPNTAKRPKAAVKAARQDKLPVFNPEREAAALKFVEMHHPELVDLLNGLKQNHPKQYEAAVRELFQTSERLASVHEKNAERHAIELELWKLKSRTQLAAARASMSGDPAFKEELRQAVQKQIDLKIELMELERQQLIERSDKLARDIDQAVLERDQQTERQVELLMHGIERPKKQTKPQADGKVAKNIEE